MMFVNKKPTWWVTGIVVIVLVVGIVVWKATTKRSEPDNVTTSDSSTLLKADKEADSELSQALNGKTMEGTLKASDNSKRGNLMLKTASTTVYIYTSRDYSSLLNKEVRVTYDGTMDDFRLGDIVGK